MEAEEIFDVLVIGAGQAGLAAGYYLTRSGLSFRIVDAGARVGDSWRNRYDSLTLFTPRRFSALPGRNLSGDAESYAGRDEFAAYLEDYATAIALPIRLGTKIIRLEKRDGVFIAHPASGKPFAARAVIVAAGGFQDAYVPAVAGDFDPGVLQLDAKRYRSPAQFTAGPVLVVGDGASGRDIAADAVKAGHSTFMASGKPRRLFPKRLFGQSIWWWLDQLGLMKVGQSSTIGRMMRRTDPFPNRGRSNRELASLGIRVMPRLTAGAGRTAQFADGAREEIGTLVWAIGYREDSSWIMVEGARDTSGTVLHECGRSPAAGLYYLGRPWQRSRSSALIMGAGPDAAYILKSLQDFLRAG